MPGGAPASRYDTILKLASGGMATVYVGTVRGALGFRQLVAIKKPHPHLLEDKSFRSEIVAEARLASMIHHANVVDVRDVEIDGDSISLVMDYIEGASLGELIVASSRLGKTLPPRVAVRVAIDALAGLHAAHELVDERDRPVGLVHRDVSPQNILVGTDGMARVADFGVAKFARKNMASTSDGSLKGKLAYMAPEYLRGEAIDRRFDIFAMGVVLWEALTGTRCFRAENEAETLQRLLTHEPAAVSTLVPGLGTAIDAILACALAKSRDERFTNAAAMGAALEAAAGAAGLLAGHAEVAATVKTLVGEAIEQRRVLVRAKLANEPSVASLMGVPSLVKEEGARAEASPITTVEMPAKTEAFATTTPHVPPMSAVPATEVDAPATRQVTMAASVVPSTLPMTPRMEGAPPIAVRTVTREQESAPAARTLASGIGGAMLGAAEAASAHAAQNEAGAAGQPAATAGSSPDLSAEYTDRATSGLPTERRWMLPLVVGVMTAVVAAAAIYGVARMGARATAGGAPSSAAPSASASVVSATSPATSASSAVTLTPLASAAAIPSSSASVRALTGKPGPHGVHSAASSAGAHKPPPNPYATAE